MILVAASIPLMSDPRRLSPVEVVLVVSTPVWDDFNVLRAKWGDYCVNGFDYDCQRKIREATRARDMMLALHWRAVQHLAIRYSEFPFSAIEVDGEVIREVQFEPECYPPYDALHRLRIGAHT